VTPPDRLVDDVPRMLDTGSGGGQVDVVHRRQWGARSVVRQVNQQAGEAAGRTPERPARHELAKAMRPISTGNLLADCERWCRDHLPPRPHRPERDRRTP
jgi:hypothetical protein